MPSSPQPTRLRPLSHIERYSSTRHPLGIYRCVVFTCRYQLACPLTQPQLYAALASVVRAHPTLRVGILGQSTNSPAFSHVPELDLRNHVAFCSVDDAASVAEYEDAVADKQGWRHDLLWQNIETQPPWQLIVVRPPQGLFPAYHEDLVFGYHHSVADGTSGKVFHEHLLAALNTPLGSSHEEASHLLSFPDPPVLPEAQQDVIPYRNTLPFILDTLWHGLAPSWLQFPRPRIWYSRNIDFSLPYKTRVLPVDVAPNVLSSLITACRNNSTSLTGLLHALTLLSLSLRLPPDEAPAFVADTPINSRRYVGPAADPSLLSTLRVLISGTSHTHPSSEVSSVRNAHADLDGITWAIARRIKNELAATTSRLPVNDPISALAYISDWFQYWRRKDGHPRDSSWEISNIGVLTSDPLSQSSTAAITRIIFTNGSMVAGPPIGLGVGSVSGGGLNIGISWQQDAVSEDLIKGLAGDLASYIDAFHETGKFKS
ncbi:hypothetical protein S40293_06012 [Stachybotrys chartarum IBT 40293]|nr:hypothetical protein S40293_06012 [Stachybotrys chartarum IBT 40293]